MSTCFCTTRLDRSTGWRQRAALLWAVGLAACNYSPPTEFFQCGPEGSCPRGLACDQRVQLCCTGGVCGPDAGPNVADAGEAGVDVSPAPAVGSGHLAIQDDGIEQLDLDTTCVANLCLTGGITP
jgi:hypothetical protein